MQKFTEIYNISINWKRFETNKIEKCNDQEPIQSNSHLAPNTKRETDTYNLDDTKIKTAQVKSQEDSSFPTDGYKAILNKLKSKSKKNRKRTNIDN